MNGGRRGLSLARLWGPGGAGVGRKDSFAAPPLCRRARALRLLGRVGPWGGCLSGFGGALGAFSAQERIESSEGGIGFVAPRLFGGGDVRGVEAAGWPWRIGDVGSSLRSGLGSQGRPQLRAGARAALRCWREGTFLARGSGRGGRTGSRRFREVRDSSSRARGPLCLAGLLGLGRGGRGVDGWVAVRAGADFFLSRALPRALPTCVFAFLQAVCSWRTHTRTFLVGLRQEHC